jgi:predicted secreted protein
MGGVTRKSLDRFFPILDVFIQKGGFRILKPFIKLWLLKYEWLCKREAAKVVNRIEDFINGGYSIMGVVGMNDSPSCGVNRTLDMTEMIRRTIIDWNKKNPMRQIVQDTLCEGSSYFVGNIISELEKRKIDIKVVGFEPWAASLKDESERVAKQLDLQH